MYSPMLQSLQLMMLLHQSMAPLDSLKSSVGPLWHCTKIIEATDILQSTLIATETLCVLCWHVTQRQVALDRAREVAARAAPTSAQTSKLHWLLMWRNLLLHGKSDESSNSIAADGQWSDVYKMQNSSVVSRGTSVTILRRRFASGPRSQKVTRIGQRSNGSWSSIVMRNASMVTDSAVASG